MILLYAVDKTIEQKEVRTVQLEHWKGGWDEKEIFYQRIPEEC